MHMKSGTVFGYWHTFIGKNSCVNAAARQWKWLNVVGFTLKATFAHCMDVCVCVCMCEPLSILNFIRNLRQTNTHFFFLPHPLVLCVWVVCLNVNWGFCFWPSLWGHSFSQVPVLILQQYLQQQISRLAVPVCGAVDISLQNPFCSLSATVGVVTPENEGFEDS